MHHRLGATICRTGSKASRTALAKQPGIAIVEVFDIKEDPVRVAEIIARRRSRYPELDGWMSVGGWPVFMRNALDPIDPAQDQVRRVRHHRPRARPASRRQGAAPGRPEILRLGQLSR